MLEIHNLTKIYDDGTLALDNVSFQVQDGEFLGIIGLSGSGKSTLLRSINRMNDLIEQVRIDGQILIKDQPTSGRTVNLIELRKNVGMVFQRPNPFPLSIFENVVFGLNS